MDLGSAGVGAGMGIADEQGSGGVVMSKGARELCGWGREGARAGEGG